MTLHEMTFACFCGPPVVQGKNRFIKLVQHTIYRSSTTKLSKWTKRNASAGNRTRAARVAGEHSTTEPPMRLNLREISCKTLIHLITCMKYDPRRQVTLVIRKSLVTSDCCYLHLVRVRTQRPTSMFLFFFYLLADKKNMQKLKYSKEAQKCFM